MTESTALLHAHVMYLRSCYFTSCKVHVWQNHAVLLHAHVMYLRSCYFTSCKVHVWQNHAVLLHAHVMYLRSCYFTSCKVHVWQNHAVLLHAHVMYLRSCYFTSCKVHVWQNHAVLLHTTLLEPRAWVGACSSCSCTEGFRWVSKPIPVFSKTSGSHGRTKQGWLSRESVWGPQFSLIFAIDGDFGKTMNQVARLQSKNSTTCSMFFASWKFKKKKMIIVFVLWNGHFL